MTDKSVQEARRVLLASVSPFAPLVDSQDVVLVDALIAAVRADEREKAVAALATLRGSYYVYDEGDGYIAEGFERDSGGRFVDYDDAVDAIRGRDA